VCDDDHYDNDDDHDNGGDDHTYAFMSAIKLFHNKALTQESV
jgi:hypothetical protein